MGSLITQRITCYSFILGVECEPCHVAGLEATPLWLLLGCESVPGGDNGPLDENWASGRPGTTTNGLFTGKVGSVSCHRDMHCSVFCAVLTCACAYVRSSPHLSVCVSGGGVGAHPGAVLPSCPPLGGSWEPPV